MTAMRPVRIAWELSWANERHANWLARQYRRRRDAAQTRWLARTIFSFVVEQKGAPLREALPIWVWSDLLTDLTFAQRDVFRTWQQNPKRMRAKPSSWTRH